MNALRQLWGRLRGWARDERGERRPGGWSQGFSGGRYWHLDPRADEIELDDVTVGLAREGRYCNQTRDVYSVAEHSVLVSVFAEELARERDLSEVEALMAGRLGLMHDGSEAFIGDVVRPLKYRRVMRGYVRLERRWDLAVRERFEISASPAVERLVKECDDRVTTDEIEALMLDPDMFARHGRSPRPEALGAEILALPWQQAAALFTARFEQLWPYWGLQ